MFHSCFWVRLVNMWQHIGQKNTNNIKTWALTLHENIVWYAVCSVNFSIYCLIFMNLSLLVIWMVTCLAGKPATAGWFNFDQFPGYQFPKPPISRTNWGALVMGSPEVNMLI